MQAIPTHGTTPCSPTFQTPGSRFWHFLQQMQKYQFPSCSEAQARGGVRGMKMSL